MKQKIIALLVAAGAFAVSADTTCITDVMLIGETNKSLVSSLQSTYTAQGWKVVEKDLNAGAGGDYIYLLYKSAESASASNGFITGFYIKTGSSDVTQKRTYKDRTYRLVPYAGGKHFMEQKGDLNSNAGGAAIHLYCTKSAFSDNRAVTGVSFNGTQSGAVGADGDSTGYDLNEKAGGYSIYMHVTTATVPYVSPVSVTDVSARQRWPWNGLVDIACTVSGIEWMPEGTDFAVAAVMNSGDVRNATHLWVMRDGKMSAVRNVSTNGDYRLVWDAGADLGMGGIHSNVVVQVTAKWHARVQLWEGGPYWATTNIGAESPEQSGYYFWWGDTVGYSNTGSGWISVKDGTSISFTENDSTAASTFGKEVASLQGDGWITADGVLAPEHDAAHVHWGGGWRMPTRQELDALVSKCNWEWTTVNGVQGWTVTGKDSSSIFLPCVGRGYGTSLYYSGSDGYYWSSVPNSGSDYSWRLRFNSSYHGTGSNYRYYGKSVRPVQGFTE